MRTTPYHQQDSIWYHWHEAVREHSHSIYFLPQSLSSQHLWQTEETVMYRIRSGGRRDRRVWITLSLVVLMHSATVGEYHSTQVSYIPVASSLNTLSQSSLPFSYWPAPSHPSPCYSHSSFSLLLSLSPGNRLKKIKLPNRKFMAAYFLPPPNSLPPPVSLPPSVSLLPPVSPLTSVSLLPPASLPHYSLSPSLQSLSFTSISLPHFSLSPTSSLSPTERLYKTKRHKN